MDEAIEIDAEGDVILICGEGDTKKRLRVCSILLSKASPVFKSLLSPRFQEGIDLRTRGSIEISLPEDDPESTEIICQIIHYQDDKAAQYNCTFDRMLRISTLCDKYDLGRLLSVHAKSWICDYLHNVSEDRISPDELEKMLTAACQFGHAGMVALVGHYIITTSKGAQSKKWLDNMATDVAIDMSAVFDALAAERRRMLDVINDDIASMLEDVGTFHPAGERTVFDSDSKCRFIEMRLKYVMDSLRSRKLWPHTVVRKRSLQQLWEALDDNEWANRDSVVIGIPGCRCSECIHNNDEDMLDMTATLRQVRAASEYQIHRLCYECVRQGKPLEEKCGHSRIW